MRLNSEGAQYGEIKCSNQRRLSVDTAKFRGLAGDTSTGCEEFFPALLIVFVSNWDLSLTIMTLIPTIKPN
jgi:hypothetical protein